MALLPPLVGLCLLLLGLRLDPGIEALLPDDPWIARRLAFLAESSAVNMVAVELASPTASGETLPAWADALAVRASAVPGVRRIRSRFPIDPWLAAGGALFQALPELLDESDYPDLTARIEEAALSRRLAVCRLDLLRPGGEFRQKWVATDPLGISELMLQRVRRLAGAAGFHGRLRGERLWSEDGRHLLVLVETDVPVTNATAGRRLLAALRTALAETAPSPRHRAGIVSGHVHAVDNEQVLRRDIAVTAAAAAIGFFLLFLLAFRDWRAIHVFAMPILGVLTALVVTVAVWRRPAAIVVGLAVTVVGIALDYAIHVFVAVKSSGADPATALRRIRRPLVFGALTTLGVFLAFAFTNTPAYRQLAVATATGICGAVFYSLYILPGWVGGGARAWRPRWLGPTGAMPTRGLWLWAVVLVALAAAVPRLRLDADLRRLDGVTVATRQTEAAFRERWGESTEAAVVVAAPTRDAAIGIHEDLLAAAEAASISGYRSPALLLVSATARGARRDRWREFWRKHREVLSERLARLGVEQGFTPDAFAPFFAWLEAEMSAPPANLLAEPAIADLCSPFVGKHGRLQQMLAFFPDTPENRQILATAAVAHPGTDIISPRAFSDFLAVRVLSDAQRVAMIGAVLVLVLSWVCLRRLSRVLVALSPVLAAVLAIAGGHGWLSLPVGPTTLVAGIVVLGLAIDYGIFAVLAAEENDGAMPVSTRAALLLSMLTTVVGSAVLLLAQHPALRPVGWTISLGIPAAWLCAVTAVPALVRLLHPIRAGASRRQPEDAPCP
jgi:predicted exporter